MDIQNDICWRFLFTIMLFSWRYHVYVFTLGAIQVLRNADGGGGVSDFLEKSVTEV